MTTLCLSVVGHVQLDFFCTKNMNTHIIASIPCFPGNHSGQKMVTCLSYAALPPSSGSTSHNTCRTTIFMYCTRSDLV
jgi:hypothetical protein